MDPMNEVRWKLYAETVRTWLPLLISVCAISMTIYQAYNTRRHTRLSVQPRLSWTVNLAGNGGISYSLTNDGFGPAVLRSLDLKLDGEVVGPDGPATCDEIDRRLGRDGDAYDDLCQPLRACHFGIYARPGGRAQLARVRQRGRSPTAKIGRIRTNADDERADAALHHRAHSPRRWFDDHHRVHRYAAP
jgi:hypothetical protein